MKKITRLFICLLFCLLFLNSGNSLVYGENALTVDQAEQELLENKEKQIIVQYKAEVKKGLTNAVLSAGIKSRRRIAPQTEVIMPEEGINTDLLIEKLENDESVLYAEKNQKLYLQSVPNDTYYSRQWGLETIMAEDAWDIIPQFTDSVTVAVIDTGIDNNHPDLIDRIASGGRNFFYDDTSPYHYDTSDFNGHGTAVSGVIAAETNNFIGIAGVAGTLDVKILPLKTSAADGSSYLEDVIEAIDYAIEKEVDVINLSMGNEIYSPSENYVIQQAIDAGILVVASAGNEENSSYLYPASYDNVISVGSVSHNSEVSDFSNRNNKVDIVAPGEDIYTCDRNSQYQYISGTSFSAPFVAGIAAVLKAIDPALSPFEIEEIIKSSALDQGPVGKDNDYGYGIVNFHQAVSQAYVAVSSISLDKLELDLMIGESQQLNTSILPANASNQSVSWYSTNTSVATVNSGLVTAVGEGTANITAVSADRSKNATCTVSVSEASSAQSDWEEWDEEKSDIVVNKSWTVKFNEDLQSSTINSTNLFITTDAAGNNKVAGISVVPIPSNASCALLIPPPEGWGTSETYYLFISTGIKSANGTSLNNAVRMKFTVEP